MTEKFEEILDQCLERLFQGEDIEACLKEYPGQAERLKPLLQLALATRQAAQVQPRPEFKAQARQQLKEILHAHPPKPPRKASPFWGGQRRWATVAITLLVLVLAGGGTVAASANSLPDEPLYPVKMLTERIQLTLTPSAIGKAKLHARFVERRVREISSLAEKGKAEKMAQTIWRISSHLEKIAQLSQIEPPAAEMSAPSMSQRGMGAGGVSELRELLLRNAVRQRAILTQIEEKASPQVKAALQQALAKSQEGYDKAMKALEQSFPESP